MNFKKGDTVRVINDIAGTGLTGQDGVVKEVLDQGRIVTVSLTHIKKNNPHWFTPEELTKVDLS